MADEPLPTWAVAEKPATPPSPENGHRNVAVTDFVRRLGRALEATPGVTVIDVKSKGMLIEFNGQKMMVGVQECL